MLLIPDTRRKIEALSRPDGSAAANMSDGLVKE